MRKLVVDSDSLGIFSHLNIGQNPIAVEVHDLFNKVYVAHYASSNVYISTIDIDIIEVSNIPNVLDNASLGETYTEVIPNNDKVYVANALGDISIIDGNTKRS